MKIPILFCFLLFISNTHAQSLEQYVIGSTGNFSSTSNGVTLSATLGELITTTNSSSSAILTQGFHQPITVSMANTQQLQQALDIQVFPNPTAAFLSIKKEDAAFLKADLIDILGQSIATYSLQDDLTEIDLQQLPAANYLLRIRTEDGAAVQTFKIQKTQ